jgi:hypothetical protein
MIEKDSSIQLQSDSSGCISFFPPSFHIQLEVEGEDADAHQIEFRALWKHQEETDSIYIYNKNHLDYLFIRNNDQRRLFDYRNPQKNTFRQMALHHLRERLYNSALRWEHFDIISRNENICLEEESNYILQENKDSLAVPEPSYKQAIQSAQWNRLQVFSSGTKPDSLWLYRYSEFNQSWQFLTYQQETVQNEIIWFPETIVHQNFPFLSIRSKTLNKHNKRSEYYAYP